MAIFRTRRILTEDAIRVVVETAEAVAIESGSRVYIAIVDRSGTVLHLRRTPSAQPASAAVAVDKARTAAIFVRPSRDIEQQVTDGRLGALALAGARALTGGIPLVVTTEQGQQVVGAIGTSGETPDEDERISRIGAAAAFTTVAVPALTFQGAELVAGAVAAAISERGVAPVTAVVDEAGQLIYLHRPDDAQVASVNVATDKARTAALYRRPSKDFEDQASGGRPSALHLAGAVPLQGGLPIFVDGYVIGAVGVSGASSADEDNELAGIGVMSYAESLAALRAIDLAGQRVAQPQPAGTAS